MSEDIVKIPHVSTLANPPGSTLVSARHEVRRNASLQAVFLKYKSQTPSEETGQKLASEIEPLLFEKIKGDEANISLTARYLADEYLQIGDAILVIDPKSGKAIAKITDDDFWTPAPVPREDGRMVASLPRLRPDLQGILIRWVFEQEREEIALAALSERLVQTPLDIEQGSRKLLPTTRGGRRDVIAQLNSLPLGALFEGLRGSLRAFTDRWIFDRPSDEGLKAFLGLRAVAQTSLGIQDWKARNLAFDVPSSFRSTLVGGWVRDIARTLMALSFNEGVPSVLDFTDFSVSGNSLFVTEAHGAWSLRKKGYEALSVGSSIEEHGEERAMLFSECSLVGYIVLGKSNITHREIHDRWDVFGSLDYDLYVNFDKITPVELRNLPPHSTTALVVS